MVIDSEYLETAKDLNTGKRSWPKFWPVQSQKDFDFLNNIYCVFKKLPFNKS